MKVSLIVAASENGVIGKDNNLIWSLPKDMIFFKETTLGHHVIMGRKNFESIPHKFRPLPNRTNIVITRNKDYVGENITVVQSLEEALNIAKDDSQPFIIGGGEIYNLAIEIADRIELTREDIFCFFNADKGTISENLLKDETDSMNGKRSSFSLILSILLITKITKVSSEIVLSLFKSSSLQRRLSTI